MKNNETGSVTEAVEESKVAEHVTNTEILADEELQAIADNGDRIQMTNIKESIEGIVESVFDDKVRVTISA